MRERRFDIEFTPSLWGYNTGSSQMFTMWCQPIVSDGTDINNGNDGNFDSVVFFRAFEIRSGLMRFVISVSNWANAANPTSNKDWGTTVFGIYSV
jgi:hypothetical protein